MPGERLLDAEGDGWNLCCFGHDGSLKGKRTIQRGSDPVFREFPLVTQHAKDAMAVWRIEGDRVVVGYRGVKKKLANLRDYSPRASRNCAGMFSIAA